MYKRQPGDYVFVSGYNFVYPDICATSASWLQGISKDAVVIFDPGPRGSDIPSDELSALIAAGFVLFLMTLGVNMIASAIVTKTTRS